ncbi:MAG: DUF4190 domain-containing protein [Phycisphaeraceae bacterium]|nr:MAG: DUF4190 domain-containing protein [Phycisphaeraceae bacterium]
MTQNPYAGDFAPEEGLYDAPPRTSALAVTSLVLSLICCIPLLPLIGAGVGIGAMIGIGSSRGRVGGKGLAIAGIIIGLLMTVGQVVAVVSVRNVVNMGVGLVFGSADQVMHDIETGDFNAARAGLTGNAASLTDEQFEAFRAAYQAEYGSYQSIPTDFFDLISAYTQIGPQMQKYQPQGSQQNILPAPATFDRGQAVVIAELEQNGQPTGQPGTPGFHMPLRGLKVVMPDGTELDLLGVPAAALPPTPTETPEEQPEPEGGP